jgi:putative ABC transport system permease protein
MWYAVNSIVRETSRFGPAVIAVAACAMLLMVQIGLFLSAMNYISKPVAWSEADLWVGHAHAISFDEGRPIPQRWITRVAAAPGVAAAEYYLMGTAPLRKAAGGSDLVTVVGVPLHDESLGAGRMIPTELRAKLRAPGAVAADASELGRLGFARPGYVGEISGQSVHYVGCTHDFKRFTGPYVFCSVETARRLLPATKPNEATYILVRCEQPERAAALAAELRGQFPSMSVNTRAEFVRKTQTHWFIRTKAGMMLLMVTIISSIVALFVTSQTLYAATAAARHEYAVLDAMGIPRRRIATAVLWQSLWVGVIAAIVGAPAAYVVSSLLEMTGVPARFEPWLAAIGAALTITTAPLSGLISLRSLQLIEPAELLH